MAANLKFANNFRFVLTEARLAYAGSFTVAYDAMGPTQTFFDIFGDNSAGHFAVPLTIVQPDDTVLGVTYAMSWDVYGATPSQVHSAFGSADAIDWAVGDIVTCRLRAEHLIAGPSKYRTSITVSAADTYDLKALGEYTHFDVATGGSGATLRLPYGTYLEDLNDYFHPRHYAVTLYDTDNVSPTINVTPEFGSIGWESGTPPAFGAGKYQLMIEIWHVTGFSWVGRWFSTP